MATKSSVVVLVEKPSIARALAPVLAKKWPNESIYLVVLFTYGGPFVFKYPRGLTWNQYPFIGEPQWKRVESASIRIGQVTQGDLQPVECNIEALLQDANRIVFACDQDHTGAVAFHTFIREVLGADASQHVYPALRLWHLRPDDIAAAVDAHETTVADWYQSSLLYGCAKRYFDYNFHVNSLAIFGKLLRKLGVNCELRNAAPGYGFYVTKFNLQALFYFREQGSTSEGSLLQAFDLWQGTGKYTAQRQQYRNPSLGSAMSRCAILTQLKEVGLLAEEAMPWQRRDGSWGARSYLRLSSLGDEFLSHVHPDCLDADIPFRLDQWCMQGLSASKPSMDRYLRTFFGKQKRFADRI